MTASTVHPMSPVPSGPSPAEQIAAECLDLFASMERRKDELDELVADMRTAETTSERVGLWRLYASKSSLISIETGFLRHRLELLKERTK